MVTRNIGLLLVLALATAVLGEDKADGAWTCGTDDFWYQGGVKTDYPCDDGKTDDCAAGPATYTRSCVVGPPHNAARCFWVHVPAAVSAKPGLKVPLVIDMHGGGGCASGQAVFSGFKDLADSLPGKDSFVHVVPQGNDKQWGTCGSDCGAIRDTMADGKTLYETDDLAFLSDLIGFLVDSSENIPSRGHINVTRVYATGFSMGCMMAHRLALEKSGVVAGFGCHGGTMIALGTDVAAQKDRFGVRPMPAYMTGGTDDAWFDMAVPAFDAWGTMNECAAGVATTNVTLAEVAGTKDAQPTAAKLKERSSCAGGASVVRLEITGAVHTTDARMAAMTWNFLKGHARAGAADAVSSTWEMAEHDQSLGVATCTAAVGMSAWAAAAVAAGWWF